MYYSTNESILSKFLSKNAEALEQLRVSFEACHGPIGPNTEVRFFREKEVNALPTLVSPDCNLYLAVKSMNFSAVAENKEFARVVLLVVLQPERWIGG